MLACPMSLLQKLKDNLQCIYTLIQRNTCSVHQPAVFIEYTNSDFYVTYLASNELTYILRLYEIEMVPKIY